MLYIFPRRLLGRARLLFLIRLGRRMYRWMMRGKEDGGLGARRMGSGRVDGQAFASARGRLRSIDV